MSPSLELVLWVVFTVFSFTMQSKFFTIVSMVGAAFVTAIIDFSVLFATSPFIKSFRDFT